MVYLVEGLKYADGSGCYAEIDSQQVVRIYADRKKAERVAKFLTGRNYWDCDEFQVREEVVK